MNNSQLSKKEVIELIKKENIYFEELPEELRYDKDIVLEAVKLDRLALYHTSERLKNDKDVVLEAMLNYKLTLQYASKRLQDDKQLLEILENQNIDEIVYLDKDKVWYYERIDYLSKIREKDLMQNSIVISDISARKNKF